VGMNGQGSPLCAESSRMLERCIGRQIVAPLRSGQIAIAVTLVAQLLGLRTGRTVRTGQGDGSVSQAS
jgi:hypothetical protein